MIYQLGEHIPITQAAIFIAPSATIIGQVTLDKNVTIWPNAVIRGDIAPIEIGANSNVQDNVTIHIHHDVICKIGCYVSIGHNAVLHSCAIDDNVVIGMGSTLLNHSRVAKNCIVGANSLVTQTTPYAEGCLIMGSPAKVVRPLTEQELNYIQHNADHYVQNGLRYQQTLRLIG